MPLECAKGSPSGRLGGLRRGSRVDRGWREALGKHLLDPLVELFQTPEQIVLPRFHVGDDLQLLASSVHVEALTGGKRELHTGM